MKHSNYRAQNTQYSLLPAADALTIYGVPKSTAIYMSQNYWSIGEEYRDLFSDYYILRWAASYFQEKLHEGTIKREGITYQVVYHRCNSATIGRGNQQLLLSFRKLQIEYKAQAVVLVTIA